jgi:hypothetical protein
MVAGQVPYRDFALEYPPLATLAFWLPAQFAPDNSLKSYRAGFGLEMVACNLFAAIAALWAWRRHLPRVVPLGLLAIWPLWLLIAGQSLTLERFDLWPAALVVLALSLHLTDRTRLAWIVLGLGAASKLYPILIAPLFLIAQGQRRTFRQVVGDGLACAAAILLPTLLVTRGDLLAVRGFFDYHLARGLEIESLYASILMLGRFAGGELNWAFRYGSIELVAPLAGFCASLALPTSMIAVGISYAAAWRTRPGEDGAMGSPQFTWLVRASLTTVTAFVIFGKVLSPQYLLWLIPLAALIPGRRGLRAWGILTVVLLLTLCVNPLFWNDLSGFAPTAIIIVLARNIVLLGFFIALLVPLRDTPDAAQQPVTRTTLRHEPAAH